MAELQDTSRAENLFYAKLAEETDRYDDLVEYMKKVVASNPNLDKNEANLYSAGYKHQVGACRAAWRSLTMIEQKEAENDSEYKEAVATYRRRIENQMEELCTTVIETIDQSILPQAVDTESRAFFWKMKADYFRYLSEITQGEQFKQVVTEALEAYKTATIEASNGLSEAHPVRLGIALNFSVFYYEALEDSEKACELAKNAIEMCTTSFEDLPEEQAQDSLAMLQLLRDNLEIWGGVNTDEEPDDEETIHEDQ